MDKIAGIPPLGEIWAKLDAICQNLWKEDRAAAVTLQAMIEEYRTEMAEADRLLVQSKTMLAEERETTERILAARHHEEIARLQERLKQTEEEVAGAKRRLDQEIIRNKELHELLEGKGRELEDFQDEALKREAEFHAKYLEKMRILCQEIYQEAMGRWPAAAGESAPHPNPPAGPSGLRPPAAPEAQRRALPQGEKEKEKNPNPEEKKTPGWRNVIKRWLLG
ncbi:MAG: hypothetical protein HYT79_10360 [Elusimicrobia bacterium]|nr:hypothetical protein [Elusimicrobiota bacterium]